MISLDQLPSDIIKIIHNELDFIGQKNLKLISIAFIKYPITNLLDNVPNRLNLTDEKLKSYPHIIKLNIDRNKKIKNISDLMHLQILNISSSYEYTIASLTNLTKLSINRTGKIIYIKTMESINHLVNLRELHITQNNIINNNDIKSLTNLTHLDIHNSINITNINHLHNLQILDASGNNCGIDNNGISNLINLTELYIDNNPNVTAINQFINLRVLNISCVSGVDNIQSLTNLIELNIGRNNKITNLDHLINLRSLYIESYSNIRNDNLILLTNLTKLGITATALIAGKLPGITHNTKITNLVYLTNLRTLYVNGDSGIGDVQIRLLTNLTELTANNNKNITDVNHLVNLQILSAELDCGIGDKGIASLTNLTKLNTFGNKKIKYTKVHNKTEHKLLRDSIFRHI